jgi:hypothetical protein
MLTLRVLVLAALISALPISADQMDSTILIGGSRVDVVVDKGQLTASNDDLLAWVRSAAESVATYYRHFPLPHILIRITPFEGSGVRHGTTFGEGGGRIRIHVGTGTTQEALKSDWMLTHEMVHLAFPSVPDAHHWIEEGIATYVEPIARVRAKHMEASEMWFELVRDLHQGLPAEGDRGLDHTHTWGRTYWGGALFCFLADLEIHQKTKNQKGLEDALRGILAAGGDIRQDWDLEKALSAGDRATGVPVLMPLYNKMKDSPYPVDLGDLWKQLGVERQGNSVVFHDDAPLSATRIAISFGTPSSSSQSKASAGTFTVFAGQTSKISERNRN